LVFNAVVLSDIPAGRTAVGIPAKVINSASLKPMIKSVILPISATEPDWSREKCSSCGNLAVSCLNLSVAIKKWQTDSGLSDVFESATSFSIALECSNRIRYSLNPLD
jgi:hypothetical protein